jgi:alpha-L-fucosidase
MWLGCEQPRTARQSLQIKFSFARKLYEQGGDDYAYHIKTYGHPSGFGYKDFILMRVSNNGNPLLNIPTGPGGTLDDTATAILFAFKGTKCHAAG